MASAVLVKSIGCRTNQEEMAALGALLAQCGHTVVDSIARADIVVVNTCLVTSVAEAKTRRYISALSRARPGVKICVTGCLAQYSPYDIMQRLPATWVVGNAFKHDIPAILRDSPGGVFHAEPDPLNPAAVSLVNTPAGAAASGRTRFFLKIQEGCNYRCAYCVVPLVRGPSASVPFERITGIFTRAVKSFLPVRISGSIPAVRKAGLNALLKRLPVWKVISACASARLIRGTCPIPSWKRSVRTRGCAGTCT